MTLRLTVEEAEVVRDALRYFVSNAYDAYDALGMRYTEAEVEANIEKADALLLLAKFPSEEN